MRSRVTNLHTKFPYNYPLLPLVYIAKIFCSASSPNLPTAPRAALSRVARAPLLRRPLPSTRRTPLIGPLRRRQTPLVGPLRRRSPPSPIGLPSPHLSPVGPGCRSRRRPCPGPPRSSRSGRRPAPARPSAAEGRAPLEAAAASGPALAPTVSTCFFPTVVSSSRDSKHAGACFGNRGCRIHARG